MQQIQLNIIPITPASDKLTFAFYGDKLENVINYSIKWDKLFDTFPVGREADKQSYYTDFVTQNEEAIIKEVDIFKAINFSQKYFRYQIFNYFRSIPNAVLLSNFIDDVEVWIPDETIPHKLYKTYNKFTLKINFKTVSSGYELVIAYNGTTRILLQNLEELADFDSQLYKNINCNGVVFNFLKIPEAIVADRETQYPVIGKDLANYFYATEQLVRKKNAPHNAYLPYYKQLQAFYNTFINTSDFNKIFKLHPQGFFNVYIDKVLKTNRESNELQFRDGTDINPFNGINNFKPFKSVTGTHIKLFFIYNEEDGALIKDTLYDYIKNGWHKPVNDVMKHTKNMERFINQTASIDPNKRITFTDNDNILEQVKEKLKEFKHEPNTRYIAIYISPVSKFDKENPQHIAYYKLKELLLKKDISSQVIFKDHLCEEAFYNFLSNIYVALLAKMGGIPWRLKADNEDEIIIGVGAFKPQDADERFVGSAFCFGNYGVFENFNIFKKSETAELAGSIRNAVEIYLERKPDAKRVIIHFYKEISDKEELKPILDMLGKLGKGDLPVIVITVNKTESREIVGFDINSSGKMPTSGSIVRIGGNRYLLFNSIRYFEDSKLGVKDYHFPIKLSFKCSTHPELLEDDDTIKQLIDQVYQFSRMYWKSISQQNLPVTTLYPEMVARIYPYFDDENLPEFGRNNLWFL
jgi:Piwi domain